MNLLDLFTEASIADIPPHLRKRLSMRDIEAEKPQTYPFVVVEPDGTRSEFMDLSAAKQKAAGTGGKVYRRNPATSQLESKKKSDSDDSLTNPRTDRILKMLRLQHPQAQNDLEALIYAQRTGQKHDQEELNRLDLENDREESDIDRLEKEVQQLKKLHQQTESLRQGEWHDVQVTFDDGSKTTVKTTGDSGYRDQITQHFAKQGKTVKDIEIDWAVKRIGEGEKKPKPTNPQLWGRAKAAAKSKFDVYPSAYANAWAAKWYKSHGGGWR